MRLNILSKLFLWQPSREILIPIISGFIVLGLSALTLKALDLGPLIDEEMVRVRRIGDHVHDHYKKLIFG
jgi:hypothetical protein